jgi:hypothetical protein
VWLVCLRVLPIAIRSKWDLQYDILPVRVAPCGAASAFVTVPATLIVTYWHSYMHFHAHFRRLLGSRGDAFGFEEVFGERYWYPHSAPAAALYAEQNNRTAMVKVS